jgi:beta-lactamase regulating signal transducer with metallopeptidase domain
MHGFVDTIAYWLADFGLTTTVLLAAALGALAVIKQPAKRLAVVKATLLAITLLAGLCAIPGWSLVHLAKSRPAPQQLTFEAPILNIAPTKIVAAAAPAIPIPNPAKSAALVTTKEAPPVTVSWLEFALAAYSLGCGATLLWLGVGMAFAHRLLRDATPAPAEINELLASVASGRPSRPQLLVSNKIDVAAALGVWRPTVLLPNAWTTGRPAAELRTVLAHEFAHVRNGDLKWLAFSRVLNVVFWLQPLYLVLRRRMRLDQESLADAAAAALSSRVTYAEQLVGWAREVPLRTRPGFASAVGLWEGRSQLRRRVAILLDERLVLLRQCPAEWRRSANILVLLTAVIVSLVTLEPSHSKEQITAAVPATATELRAKLSGVSAQAVLAAPSGPRRSDEAAGSVESQRQSKESTTASELVREGSAASDIGSHVAARSSASIEGQVIGFFSGEPVEDVIVRASGQPAGSQPQMIMITSEGTLQSKTHLVSTRTDSTGKYRFANLPEGEYTVWAESPLGDIGSGGGLCRGLEGLKVGVGSSPTVAPTLIIGPGAKIFGRLVDGDTGKPLSFAARGVTLQATGVFVGSSWLQDMPVQQVPVSADGAFEIRAYPGKSHFIVTVTEQEPLDSRGKLIYRMDNTAVQSGPVLELKHGQSVQATFPVWSEEIVERRDAKQQAAFALLKPGKYDDAIAAFSQAIAADPKDHMLFVGRSYAYEYSGRWREAIDDCNRSIAMRPELLSQRTRLADLLATAPDASVRDGRRAITMAKEMLADERDWNMLQILAAGQAETGDFKAAVTTQRQAIEAASAGLPESWRDDLRNRLKVYQAGKPYRRAAVAE